MNLTAVLIAALVVLPAAGLVVWSWFVMAQVEEELLVSSGFKNLHFEV